MPNAKISALNSGGSLLSTDLVAIVRGGASYNAAPTDIIPHAATVAALASKDVSDVTDGQQLELRGYTAAGDKSPLRYGWDADDDTADNSGTVIQPASAPATGRWRAAYGQVITPYDFGAVHGYNDDSTNALQAFLDAVAVEEQYRFAFVGKYGITSSLIMDGVAQSGLHCELDFRAISAVDGYGLEFKSVSDKRLTGWLRYDNQEQNNWSSRTGDWGFLVGPAASRTYLPRLYAKGCRHFGVHCIVNSNFGTIESVETSFCGSRTAPTSAGRSVLRDFVVLENTGTLNSYGQRSVIQVTGAMPDILATPLGLIDGKYYGIESGDEADELKVFPWISATPDYESQIDFVAGGGLLIEGNGSNSKTIGEIMAINGGIGLYVNTPFGPSVNGLHTEFSEIGCCIGKPGLNQAIGTSIKGAYFEGTRVDIVRTTYALDASVTLIEPGSFSTAFGLLAQNTAVGNDPNSRDPRLNVIAASVRSTSELEDVGHEINTNGKVDRLEVYNSTTNQFVYAAGIAATDVWRDKDGVTIHTPV